MGGMGPQRVGALAGAIDAWRRLAAPGLAPLRAGYLDTGAPRFLGAAQSCREAPERLRRQPQG
jgi:hypothetical protein